jgi:hypothetical protein
MDRERLVGRMVHMLQQTLDERSEGTAVQASSTLPLVGPEAVVSSMGLVTFITDVESMLQEQHQMDVVLVSEQALSRKNSPFRTIETLADYVLEFAEHP